MAKDCLTFSSAALYENFLFLGSLSRLDFSSLLLFIDCRSQNAIFHCFNEHLFMSDEHFCVETSSF